jgi:hypothetical protein
MSYGTLLVQRLFWRRLMRRLVSEESLLLGSPREVRDKRQRQKKLLCAEAMSWSFGRNTYTLTFRRHMRHSRGGRPGFFGLTSTTLRPKERRTILLYQGWAMGRVRRTRSEPFRSAYRTMRLRRCKEAKAFGSVWVRYSGGIRPKSFPPVHRLVPRRIYREAEAFRPTRRFRPTKPVHPSLCSVAYPARRTLFFHSEALRTLRARTPRRTSQVLSPPHR